MTIVSNNMLMLFDSVYEMGLFVGTVGAEPNDERVNSSLFWEGYCDGLAEPMTWETPSPIIIVSNN